MNDIVLTELDTVNLDLEVKTVVLHLPRPASPTYPAPTGRAEVTDTAGATHAGAEGGI